MAEIKSGVYACYDNQFAFGAVGETTPSTPIADCEEFSVSINNGIEEWNSFENQGFKSRLLTAKDITIAIKAKRTVGDPGNDEIAGLILKTGHDCERNFLWNLPDGSSILFKNAVISVTNNGTGAATGVAPLEFEVLSNGKPVYTPAA